MNGSHARSRLYRHVCPPGSELADAILQQELIRGDEAEKLKTHPVAVWLENRIALDNRDGVLVRGKPKRLSQIISALSLRKLSCRKKPCIDFSWKQLLQWISIVERKTTKRLASPTPCFHLSSINSYPKQVRYIPLSTKTTNRYITLEPGVFKHDEADKKPIFPNVFSRASGHAFICVSRLGDKLEPREFRDSSEGDTEATDGYLCIPDEDVKSLYELEL